LIFLFLTLGFDGHCSFLKQASRKSRMLGSLPRKRYNRLVIFWETAVSTSLFRPIPATGKQPAAVIFDLDKTLIDGNASILWTEYLYEKGFISDPSYRENDRAMAREYRRGTLDIAAWISKYGSAISSVPKELVDQTAAAFADEKIAPLAFRDGLDRIREAKEKGMAVLIVSASCAFLVRPIAVKVFGLAPEDAVGLELAVRNGAYQAEIEGTPSFQEGKIERARAALEARGLKLEDAVFITDSRNDLPLAEAAGDCETVNPDHGLREIAMKKHWRVYSWIRW
jgi:HAD superfamily hydrolase (TIGR01490 family)